MLAAGLLRCLAVPRSERNQSSVITERRRPDRVNRVGTDSLGRNEVPSVGIKETCANSSELREKIQVLISMMIRT